MPVNRTAYQEIMAQMGRATLVAVSKTKPVEDIRALYELGHRDFGENYVQELVAKQPVLPSDIRWHFIGHLQSNKVKYIAPFVHMIHGVDSLKLLQEIHKQAGKSARKIKVLLQVFVASEETKFGLDETELRDLLTTYVKGGSPDHVEICGLMAMASFTENLQQVRAEFGKARELFRMAKREFFAEAPSFSELSMGMSGDFTIALEEGSSMVRIGSLLFGERRSSNA